jgi:hypothetical protein
LTTGGPLATSAVANTGQKPAVNGPKATSSILHAVSTGSPSAHRTALYADKARFRPAIMRRHLAVGCGQHRPDRPLSICERIQRCAGSSHRPQSAVAVLRVGIADQCARRAIGPYDPAGSRPGCILIHRRCAERTGSFDHGGNRNYRTAPRHNSRRVECLAGCQARAASLRWSRLRSRSFWQSRTASSISCRASSSFPRRLSSSPRTLGSR